MRVDYQPHAESARQLQVPRISAAQRRSFRARFPGSTTAGRTITASTWSPAVDCTLDGQPDVRRGILGREHAPSGRLLDRRRRSELVHHRRLPVNADSRTAPRPGSATFRICSRTRRSSIRSTWSYQILNNLGSGSRRLGRHARAGGADVPVGQPHRERAAEQQQPVQQLHSRHRGGNAQRHADARSAARTRSRPATTTSRAYQKRGTGGDLSASINFAQRHANNPLDTSFGFANAALGVFSSYSQLSRWGEGAYTAINHEGFVQDNWKMTRTA